jgi:DnaK suppressor protein
MGGHCQPAVDLDRESQGTNRPKTQSNGASQLHQRGAKMVTRVGDVEGASGIMATTKSTKVAGKTSRYNELKTMLEERRRELLSEVQGKIRDVRAESGKERDVLDQGESSEVDIQEDIEFALIQMKSETLNKINEALRRLDEGTYGNCFECGDEIAHARLRALPFAVRCKDCEEARETAEQRERMLARKSGSAALFFDMSN